MFSLFAKRKRVTEIINRDEEFEAPSVDTELELGHVGPYEIVAPIGSGGMGTVYKAIDRKRDKTVAIKVLNREYDLIKKKRKADYLGREIMIAAALQHESIVRIHQEIIVERDREGNLRRCLLMEFVDGFNLRKFIRDRDLNFRQMFELCRKLCMGLDFLHQNNVVHRDIKPENFLVTRDLSQVKIVDFGLSKSTSGWLSFLDKEGGGTRKYMSPEQLAKKKLDARSDIFSFGLTMYELFTGRHACSATEMKEMMRQLRSSKYRFEPPSKYNPEVPPQLDKILLKALRRSPSSRYQSMTEMLLDLSRVGESRI